jgi:hypothetical protein
VEETPWGKELKELWTNEGRAEGRVEGHIEGRAEGLSARLDSVRRQLKTLEEMFSKGELPKAAYTRLKKQSQRELKTVEAELAQLQNGASGLDRSAGNSR